VSETTPSADYIERRLKPQLAWYERRARTSKQWRYFLAGVQIVATILIPVVNVFTHSVYLSSALAGVAAMATAFESLFGHQDQWLAYRSTARALETLLMRFDLKLPPYDGEDRDAQLIEDAESVLEAEGANWRESVKQRASAARAPNIVIGS
jgi:hypothetical protein